MAMNINDPQSRMEIDALANEIKAIANSMYLELANSESNPSHIQVQFTPQNPLQPTYSESIPVRYTTSYEPSISIDTNNIQSATHPLTSTNEYTNLQSYQTKNYNISSNPEPYYKTPDNSKLPPYNSTTSPYQQDGVVSELNQLNSKMDEFLQRRSISPSKNQTPKTNEYSFQQHQNLYSPKTKEFQTNLTVNTKFEKLKSSPKWDQSESLTSTARNAQATPISDLQDKNVAISFVQEKRTNWTPSPTPLDHHIIPKINTADEHKMITTPSYNLQALVSPTSASKKQNYDKTKLDHILQNITKRNYTSTSPPATLLASPTHSLSNSKSVQDIFLVSSNLNPMQTDPQNLVSFAAHKTNSSILKNPPVGHSPQTTPTDVISQIGRDFAKLKVEPTQTNLNDTLTPTPFRVNTAELSKKSASPSIDSYGHRRIKSGIDQLQFPYMTPQPIKGTSYPYPSTQSQGYLPTDLRYSTESRGLHERNKSLHSFQSFTPKEYNTGMGNVSASISQAQMQQLQRLQESEEKLDRILGKSQSNKNVKFLRKLPDTTEEQPFTSAHPTETIKRSTYRSISPTKSYGERGTVKQEISFKKFESLKPSATASEKKRFMNKTEPVVI